MDNTERLAKIRARNKRYGLTYTCPRCNKSWWHEDEDYIVNGSNWITKLQCPYCECIFVTNG